MLSSETSERLEVLCRRLACIVAHLPALDATVQFDLGADGGLFMDARPRPPAVTVGSGSADCTLAMEVDTLERVLTGKLDGIKAFMQGQMTISGDVELAVRLNEWLNSTVAGESGIAQPG